jgi:hypothetical protein
MARDLLIVCKYARRSRYAEEARELRASAAALGYEVLAIEAPDEGDWWRNTANKPGYILQAMQQHDGPILSLDADCRILKPLDEMLRLLDDADVAVKYRQGSCFSALFNAAVLLMRKTPATLAMVETWANQGSQFGSLHRFVEQGAFAEGVLMNQHRLRLCPLPEKFHTMHPVDAATLPPEAVIIHLKASRSERSTALPKTAPVALTPPPQNNGAVWAMVRPRIDTTGGLPMTGVAGHALDCVEYASRHGILSLQAVEVDTPADPRHGLDAWKPGILSQLCGRFPLGTRIMLCDHDVLFLRDTSIFAETAEVADVVLSWDRRNPSAVPSTAFVALKTSAAVRDVLLPRLEQQMREGGPRGTIGGSPASSFARALALTLRHDLSGNQLGNITVATFPESTIAEMAQAGRDTLVLSTRGALRFADAQTNTGPARPHFARSLIEARVNAPSSDVTF